MTAAEFARRFLGIADRDIRAFTALSEIEGMDANTLFFHAQQAVEKCLKAVLFYHEVDFPRTHDLNALLLLIKKIGVEFPLAATEVDKLTPYAVLMRDSDDETAALTIAEAAELISTIRRWAEQTINF